MISLIPAETLDRLRHVFGSRVDSLAAAELQALATADVEGSVSNVRLQELLIDHPVDITRMLTRLCEQGLLVSDNRRRWTTYRSVADPGSHRSLIRGTPHICRETPDICQRAPDIYPTRF